MNKVTARKINATRKKFYFGVKTSQLGRFQLGYLDIKSFQIKSPQIKSPQIKSPQIKSFQIKSFQIKSPQLKQPGLTVDSLVASRGGLSLSRGTRSRLSMEGEKHE